MNSNTDADTHGPAPNRSITRRPVESGPDLEHVTIENADVPDECAIFPREMDPDCHAAWIAALEGSFVDLETVR